MPYGRGHPLARRSEVVILVSFGGAIVLCLNGPPLALTRPVAIQWRQSGESMDSKKSSEVDGILSGGDLTTLVDLQKFLAEELSPNSEQGGDLSRAFLPLTDGLGIHATTKRPGGATKAGAPSYVPPGVSAVTEFRTTQPITAPVVRPSQRMILDDTEDLGRFADAPAEDFAVVEPPPPVPSAALGRRFVASLIDQAFVVGAWMLALVITSSAMSSATGDLSVKLLREFNNPAFIRFAWLEFGMIWLGYLTLSFGFLEMTLGMWVWGLRVNFGPNGRFWRKMARIVMSMFFYPFVAPTFLLLFRKEGSNLIDGISQSTVYRTGQA